MSEQQQPQRQPSIEERIAAAVSPPLAEPQQESQSESTDQAVGGQLDGAPEDVGQQDVGPAEAEREAPSAAAGEPAESGEQPEAGGEEVETIELGSLGDVAQHLGVPVEDLYGLTVPIDVEGKRQELSIGEWKDRVRAGIESDVLAEQRKAFADERKQAEERLQQQGEAMRIAFAEAAALTEAAERQLQGEVENLAAIRESDPAEWAAKQTELKQRQDAIEASKRELRERWQAQVETQQAEVQTQLQAHIARERDSLLEAIPEWRDEDVFTTERREMRDYLSMSGFSEQEIETAVDHRLILMARKAMRYDAQQAQASLSRKRVAKVAKKVVKPGATQGKQAAKEDAFAKLRAQHKKSGSTDSAAALIAAKLRG